MSSVSLEQIIERYERQFANGDSPDIRDFLDCECEDRRELLLELVHTEIELQVRDGKKSRVEQYLARFPEIADDRKAIGELIQTEYRTREQFEPGVKLQEFVLRFPDTWQVLIDNVLLKPGLAGSRSSGDGRNHHVDSSFSDESGRFRKSQLHEQGGLGNVWLANDLELDRRVAVKEIKAKYSASDVHRLRFLREVQITSRLEHPGILPVYGLGQLANGAPYFAMQFVKGRNFRQAIVEFHATDEGRDGKQSLEFRRLIRHFLDVCNTLQYAHARGVVHRDIKPENIMIGQYGETFVVDWGLAKTNEPERAADSTADQTLYAGMTTSLDGLTIGSPAFMSPEQFEGNQERVSPVSDVYNLGATLLSLIANTDNPNKFLQSDGVSRHGAGSVLLSPEFKPLVSICRKAMAKETSCRYQSVELLSEDVDNFLLERPVSAHRESIGELVTRSSRRYRAVLNTALVAFALLSGIALFAAIWINFARQQAVVARLSESKLRREAESSLLQEADARAEAEKRTEQLTDTVRIFADLFSGSDDAGLRIDLDGVTLQDGLLELDKMADRQHAGPLVKAFLNVVVARNRKGKGQYNAAIEYYRQAISILRDDGIAESDSLYVDFLVGLCSAYSAAGNNNQAERIANRIVSICRRSPEKLQRAYFNTLLAQAKTASRQEKQHDALQFAHEACVVGESLYSSEPDDINLLWSKFVLAGIQQRLGDIATASQNFAEIVEVLRSKNRLHPLGFASNIQLAEIRLADSPETALELVESANAGATAYFGASHPDAIEIRARLGKMLAGQTNAAKKNEGIEILESCRNQQIELFGLDNYEVLGTTWLLANALLSFQDASHSIRAVEIIEESLNEIKNAEIEDPAPALPAALSEALSSAHLILGDKENSLCALRTSLLWHTRAFGENSLRTRSIRERIKDLETNSAGE